MPLKFEPSLDNVIFGFFRRVARQSWNEGSEDLAKRGKEEALCSSLNKSILDAHRVVVPGAHCCPNDPIVSIL